METKKPEELFLENIPLIERIAAHVCRSNYVSGDDREEFTQEVKVRLIDNDYAILRKFEGKSLLSTYLTTVVTRLFHQHRIALWGKWRPSAEAKRLGDKAVTLERLVTRDGHTLEEAINILTTWRDSPFTRAELERIYLLLPVRSPRPVLVSEEASAEVPSPEANAEERVLAQDREKTGRRLFAIVDKLLEGLPAEDRIILRMRFYMGQKVSDIARKMNLDQKKLYKRLDRLFDNLRGPLEEHGIHADDIDTLLASGDQVIEFRILQPGNPPHGTSNEEKGGAIEGGESRIR